MEIMNDCPDRSQINCDNPRYDDKPDFKPDLSPLAMAKLGVFGGAYFADDIDDCKGIPDAILDKQTGKKDKSNNAFKVNSGMSREKWDERGWLTKENPRGWYEWYCRFHEGERFDEDDDQIERWKDFGNRWTPGSKEALNNMNPGPGSRQALLHWAYNPYTPEIAVEQSS